MEKIVIYGNYPPPYGGVSVPIKRFISYLKRANIDYQFYNSREVSFLKFFLFNLHLKKRIIHVHGFQAWAKQILLLFLKFVLRKRVIVTIHNDRFLPDYHSKSIVSKLIARLFFNHISSLIAVNPRTDFGFVKNNKIVIIPDFIKPLKDEIDVKKLPDQILAIKKQTNFLITANAYQITFYKNEDLYGIDLSIHLTKKLLQNGFSTVRFLYVIANIGDHKYLASMTSMVRWLGLDEHFFFHTNPIAYPALLSISDLFLRPTNTDGDASSVREALSLHCPVVASDVSPRPDGTILFRNRDVNDLYNKVVSVIQNPTEYRARLRSVRQDNNPEKIIKLYREVSLN